MGKKILAIAAVIVVAGAFALSRHNNVSVPSDFRDAVTDQIPGKAEATLPDAKAKRADPPVKEATDLTSLINLYLEIQENIDVIRSELVSPVFVERSLQRVELRLQRNRDLAERFSADVSRVLAKTPANRDTRATVSLLKYSIRAYFFDQTVEAGLGAMEEKSPELKSKTRPLYEMQFSVKSLLEGCESALAPWRPQPALDKF